MDCWRADLLQPRSKAQLQPRGRLRPGLLRGRLRPEPAPARHRGLPRWAAPREQVSAAPRHQVQLGHLSAEPAQALGAPQWDRARAAAALPPEFPVLKFPGLSWQRSALPVCSPQVPLQEMALRTGPRSMPAEPQPRSPLASWHRSNSLRGSLRRQAPQPAAPARSQERPLHWTSLDLLFPWQPPATVSPRRLAWRSLRPPEQAAYPARSACPAAALRSGRS